MRTVIGVVVLFFAVTAYAHTSYTGRSGSPGRQTCASSCHGGPVVNTVEITGFPIEYVPGAAYLLTIRRISGGTIVNFNGSCRVGLSGTTNAGVISAALATTIYNVTGETNGVRFSTANRDSGQFTWTAPAAGTGVVRFYAGAIQTDLDGDNSTIVLTANEAAPLPGIATVPIPADMSVDVATTVVLNWTAGAGALSHDVFFDTVNPPAFAGNQVEAAFDPPGELQTGTTYYWRVDERNAAGVTAGPVWQFVTRFPASPPTHLTAALDGDGIRLYWAPSPNATVYNVYRDTLEVVNPVPANLVGSTVDTTYSDISPVPSKATYIITAQ
ncbi:MAG: hypothetical protein IPG71_04025 [bacterium]|nr:hypothetical protein [bacterium]